MRRGTLLASLFFVALNVGHPQALAQNTSAQRPILKVGDTWTYAVRYTGQQSTPASQTTIAVANADGGQVTSTWQDTVFGSGTVQFDSNLNLIQRVRAPSFIDFRASPFRPNYQWPLYPGAAWQGSFEYTASNGGRQYQASLNTRVVGIERVTVPAGSFDAYKIVRKLDYRGFDGKSSWAGIQDETVWYAPQAKTFVKSETTDHGPRYAEQTAIRELVSYNLK